MSGFVTLLLVFCYPETKFIRQDIHEISIEMPSKDIELSPVHEKKVTSKRNSANDIVDGLYVRKGRPSKGQFAPVTKPEQNWMSYVVRDLTTPILAFCNPWVVFLNGFPRLLD